MVDYKTGDRVRITGGQYKGMIGKLRGVSKDSGRCTVELDAGSDPSLLDNCYFTSIVEIERAPDDVVSKPAPKDFPDIDELAAQAKEMAKTQQPKAEPKRPMFARKNKHQEKPAEESMDFEDIFVDDFAAASVDNEKTALQFGEEPKEFNPEEFTPKSFEPLPTSAATEETTPVPEPMPIPEPTPVVETPEIISNPIPSMAEPEPVEEIKSVIPDPIPSQEQPKVARMAEPIQQEEYQHQESQPKEMQEKPMDNQEFVPKFRQESPKPQEFIPLPCRNCRLKDQRENCSPKEFSECQAAYAFDEYLKEHSVQLFVEQILIPEMNQVGVTEPEKKAMLQRLLLEL